MIIYDIHLSDVTLHVLRIFLKANPSSPAALKRSEKAVQ